MGYMSALDMNEHAGCNYQTMQWHLMVNHWPPNSIPECMIEFCLKAVRYANQGKFKTQIRLPKDATYHGKRMTYHGKYMVPVYVVIEHYHLDAFINQDEEE